MGAEDRPSSPPPGGAARQRLAPHRVTWRSRGALILRDVLGALVAGGNDAASQRAVADRLGVDIRLIRMNGVKPRERACVAYCMRTEKMAGGLVPSWTEIAATLGYSAHSSARAAALKFQKACE